jgi:alpha-N-arabinofuranosidase
VDEWGTWHPPAPGQVPQFLWQQNTLRDALVAALTLDVFNHHADKVVMANIAQTINVLQAVILTEGPKMLVTPTGHVYAMYAQHQGATALRIAFESESISVGNASLFGLAGSASLKDNRLFMTVVNPNADTPMETTISLGDGRARSASATVLTHGDIHAHNTFESPNTLEPFEVNIPADGAIFNYTFPPASVTAISVLLG